MAHVGERRGECLYFYLFIIGMLWYDVLHCLNELM